MKKALLLLLTLTAALPCRSADTVFAKHQPEVEASVEKGLAWLASRQSVDGSFIGGEHGDTTGIVSLCGMAFLSTGDTPGRGKWGKNILACIQYVLASQQLTQGKPEYGMLTRNPHSEKMYSHCIATLFLSEVSGMLEPALQTKVDEAQAKALALIIRAQNVPKDERQAGGWRYLPDARDSDLSLTGWALMALKSARLNGAEIPTENIDKAVKYIKQRNRADQGTFGYQGDSDHADSLTGAGLLCLELTGHHGEPETIKAAQWILKNHRNLPGKEFELYGNYYNAQAMFQIGGEYWDTYAEWMYSTYLKKQKDEGNWEGRDGPHYSTALAVLAFTVPYRQLPIYQRDEMAGQN
jgi:hypothetical protein